MQLKNPGVETARLAPTAIPQFLNQDGKSFNLLAVLPDGYTIDAGGNSVLSSVLIVYMDMTEIIQAQRAAQEARAAELQKRNRKIMNGEGIVIPELERQRN